MGLSRVCLVTTFRIGGRSALRPSSRETGLSVTCPVYQTVPGKLPIIRLCRHSKAEVGFAPGMAKKQDQKNSAAKLSSLSVLLSRQHGRQKPEFGLHFDGIGYSIGDFLAKEFAIALAKPVNGHLERSF